MAKRSPSPAAEIKREEIKNAAKNMFGTKGYVATSMRGIASAVKMEDGSLYYHFKSKEELLAVLLSEGNEMLIAAANECIARQPNDPTAALREIITSHMRILVKDRTRFMIALADLSRLNKERRKRIVDQRTAYERVIQKIIERGVEAGTFNKCNVKVVSYAIIAIMNSVAFWFNPQGPLSIEDVSREQIALVMDGIVKNKARS